MPFPCWLCGQEFDTRKDFKNHIAAAPHHRLQVVCPWCTTTLHTCNRAADLKKHVEKVHAGMVMLLPAGFFGETTCFYLSTNPIDYARTIKPSAPELPGSVSAVNAIKCWLPAGLLSRSLEDWEEGWTQAIGTPLQSEPAAAPEVPPTPPASPAGAQYSPNHPGLPNAPVCLIKGHFRESDRIVLVVRIEGKDFVIQLNQSAEVSTSVLGIMKDYPTTTLPETTNRVSPSRDIIDRVHLAVDSIGISEYYVDGVQECWVRPPAAYKPSLKRPRRVESPSELLAHGVMPLLPPARRGWSDDGVIQFSAGSGTISWPPAGWTRMTPERRLVVAEYAAMQLDVGADGYPSTPREQLMATYNFLVLPGTTVPTPSVMQKMWFYNYSMLVDCIRSKHEDAPFVGMVRSAAVSRDTSTDRFIRQMDAANIKLRI